MNQLRVPPIGGDHWGMMASRKWETRIADVLRERGLQPATDAALQAADDAAHQEWLEMRSRVLLGRLDSRYQKSVIRHAESNRWLMDYRLGNRHGYVIQGRGGAGKTWEASALARELLLTDSTPVTMVGAVELMAGMRPNKDGTSDLGTFQVAPVLVIDDLGVEKPTEWTSQQLYALAEYRNARRLPVILTTNLTGAQLRERYDPRTVDRLVEDATLLQLPDRTYRNVPL